MIFGSKEWRFHYLFCQGFGTSNSSSVILGISVLKFDFQKMYFFFFNFRRWVDPYETVRITVWLEAQGAEGSTDVVSFTAHSLEPVTRNVYLHIGREVFVT